MKTSVKVCAISIAVVASVVSILVMAPRHIKIVTVGSTSYTYADVRDVYSFTKEVADITGMPGPVNKDSVFNSLVTAALQKEILQANKIQVDKAQAYAFLDQFSGVKGLLVQKKESLGEDLFYTRFVEPFAVGMIFQEYYKVNDPQRLTALKVLDQALKDGFEAAAQKNGIVVKSSVILANKENAEFFTTARKYQNSVIPQIIEDSAAYAVAVPLSFTEQGVTLNVAAIPKLPFSTFIKKEAEKLKIQTAFSALSIYRQGTLEKPGGVFENAKKEGADKAASSKKD